MGVLDLNKFKKSAPAEEKKTAPDELPSLPEKTASVVPIAVEQPKTEPVKIEIQKTNDAPTELPPINQLPKESKPVIASTVTQESKVEQNNESSQKTISEKTQEQIKQNIESAKEKVKDKPEPHDIVSHRNYKNSLFVEVQKQLSDPEKRLEFEKNFLNVNPITEIKERIQKESKQSMVIEYEKVINEYVENLKHLEGHWRKLQEEVDDRKKTMKTLEHDIDEKTFELKNLIMKLHEVREE